MKNGKKEIVLITAFAVGYFYSAYKANLEKKNRQFSNKPTVNQYKNRLEEFCLDDLSQAHIEYQEFLDMGFTPTDSFELTIVKRVFV